MAATGHKVLSYPILRRIGINVEIHQDHQPRRLQRYIQDYLGQLQQGTMAGVV